MPVLLVVTVGGSPRPIIESILAAPRPDRILFLCSTQSREMLGEDAGAAPETLLPALRAAGCPYACGQYEVYMIGDPQNLTTSVRDIERHITPEVSRWRTRDQSGAFTVAVDFTGGTKVMSVALAYVARRWDCTFRYVGGTTRTKAGLGPVQDRYEEILESVNPLEALGYQLAEDALTLCAEMDFRAAERLLSDTASRQRRPEVQRSLQTLRQLVQAFSHWDSFRHKEARTAIEQVEKNQNDLSLFLAPSSVDRIHAGIPGWSETLLVLSEAANSTFPLVEDLLSNALRRGKERRFDDAVSRLYRAVEALAQAALATRHDVPSTSRVNSAIIPWDRLAPDVAHRWRTSARREDNSVELALTDSYRLLDALGDPLGGAFSRSDFADPKRNPLKARNHSILAHGYRPIQEGDFRSLKTAVFQLAQAEGLSEESIFRFPILERRGL
ncbi:MAG TPA: TIGR02710 family CRISPR-associated CARF protein [Paludibaculum sp.]|jgi:CRISPR-associated protein (TIGR02710 family)